MTSYPRHLLVASIVVQRICPVVPDTVIVQRSTGVAAMVPDQSSGFEALGFRVESRFSFVSHSLSCQKKSLNTTARLNSTPYP